MQIQFNIIVAMAKNSVIGRDGAMPWRLPTDLKFFKQTTMGKPVIMGRKTWVSLNCKPLPGRMNIVITRDKDFVGYGVEVAHSLEEAQAIAIKEAEKIDIKEVFIIGGGEIYKQAIAIANNLYVTTVAAEIAGDTFFPKIDNKIWHIIETYPFEKSEKDSHFAQICKYGRLI